MEDVYGFDVLHITESCTLASTSLHPEFMLCRSPSRALYSLAHVRRFATSVTFHKMSAPVDLAYTSDRQAELRENIESVQAEIDAAAGSSSKVNQGLVIS